MPVNIALHFKFLSMLLQKNGFVSFIKVEFSPWGVSDSSPRVILFCLIELSLWRMMFSPTLLLLFSDSLPTVVLQLMPESKYF